MAGSDIVQHLLGIWGLVLSENSPTAAFLKNTGSKSLDCPVPGAYRLK